MGMDLAADMFDRWDQGKAVDGGINQSIDPSIQWLIVIANILYHKVK